MIDALAALGVDGLLFTQAFTPKFEATQFVATLSDFVTIENLPACERVHIRCHGISLPSN